MRETRQVVTTDGAAHDARDIGDRAVDRALWLTRFVEKLKALKETDLVALQLTSLDYEEALGLYALASIAVEADAEAERRIAEAHGTMRAAIAELQREFDASLANMNATCERLLDEAFERLRERSAVLDLTDRRLSYWRSRARRLARTLKEQQSGRA